MCVQWVVFMGGVQCSVGGVHVCSVGSVHVCSVGFSLYQF